MKMEQSVSKRRYIKFRRRGITQKKTYNSALYNLVRINKNNTIESTINK
jgi:hypothetical protein